MAGNWNIGSGLEQFRIENKPDVHPATSISSPFAGPFLSIRYVPVQNYKRLYYLSTNVTS